MSATGVPYRSQRQRHVLLPPMLADYGRTGEVVAEWLRERPRIGMEARGSLRNATGEGTTQGRGLPIK